jgi:hypothetical protein
MFYEEMWINDELMYRTSPNGKFKKVTRKTLLKRIKELEEKIESLVSEIAGMDMYILSKDL